MLKRQESEELPNLQHENEYTLEQIKEFQKAFVLFDKDKDGFVSQTELKKVLAALGYPNTDESIKKLISAV
jgi:Ca2+-binding EF-hand superfamily protein